MSTRREALFALGGVLAAAGGVAAAAQTGKLQHFPGFSSRHAAKRDVWVWTPPGYAPDGPRHDVLCMHDGGNLFERGAAFGGEEWGVDETLSALIAGGAVRPTVVVGIGNTPLRFREYMPQGLWTALPEDQRETVTRTHGGEPLSAGYLRFITEELLPWVATRYRVAGGPEHTSVAGSSMGGLVSLAALVEYPAVFGAAACLSTHWPCIVPTSLDPRPAAESTGVANALSAWMGPRLAALHGHRLYLDRGDGTLDALYPPFQDRVDAWLASVVGPAGLTVESRVFPGAEHNERSWRARLATPLRFLLGR